MSKAYLNLKVFFCKYDVPVLLLLAALLRVFGRTSASYGVSGELYRDLTVVYNFIHLGKWPLLGPSSSLGGFNFGAIYYYLLTPFVWLFHFAPYGGVLISAVFSVLSVWMLYKLCMAWFGRKDIARLTAFCLAISAYDIQYSYFVSNPNLMPFFTLWFLYCLTKILEDGMRWKYFMGLGLSFGVVTQLHATALLLMPAVLLFSLLWTKKNVFNLKFLSATLMAAAIFVPYFIYEFSHHFLNLLGIMHLGEHNFSFLVRPGSILASTIFWEAWLVSRGAFFDFLQDYPVIASVIIGLMLALLVGEFYFGKFKQTFKDFISSISKPGLKVLIAWLAMGSLMFLLYQRPIQPFYFLVLWPAPLVLFIWFQAWTNSNAPRLAKLVVAVYAVTQVLQLCYFYPQVYRPDLDYKNVMGDFVFVSVKAQGQSYNVMNQLMDINEFLYYRKITDFEQAASRVHAQKLYVFCAKNDVAQCSYGYPGYKKTGLWPHNEILIAEYQRQ